MTNNIKYWSILFLAWVVITGCFKSKEFVFLAWKIGDNEQLFYQYITTSSTASDTTYWVLSNDKTNSDLIKIDAFAPSQSSQFIPDAVGRWFAYSIPIEYMKTDAYPLFFALIQQGIYSTHSVKQIMDSVVLHHADIIPLLDEQELEAQLVTWKKYKKFPYVRHQVGRFSKDGQMSTIFNSSKPIPCLFPFLNKKVGIDAVWEGNIDKWDGFQYIWGGMINREGIKEFIHKDEVKLTSIRKEKDFTKTALLKLDVHHHVASGRNELHDFVVHDFFHTAKRSAKGEFSIDMGRLQNYKEEFIFLVGYTKNILIREKRINFSLKLLSNDEIPIDLLNL